MEKNILFPGFINDDDLPAVYSAATLFVFPSLAEGFGLPPLEAMACGTPCVVSNSSSLPEVTGPAALLFDPTSLESFENCVARVLGDPVSTRPLGKKDWVKRLASAGAGRPRRLSTCIVERWEADSQ